MNEIEPEDEYLWQQGDCILELPEWQEESDGEPVPIGDVLRKVIAEIGRRIQGEKIGSEQR